MDESYRIGVFPTTVQTWSWIVQLQKSLRNTPKRLVLYGRSTSRKKLAEYLHKNDVPYCYVNGDKLSVEQLITVLRGRIPLVVADRVAVYIKDRPKTRWARRPSTYVWEQVPTKWATVDKS